MREAGAHLSEEDRMEAVWSLEMVVSRTGNRRRRRDGEGVGVGVEGGSVAAAAATGGEEEERKVRSLAWREAGVAIPDRVSGRRNRSERGESVEEGHKG